MDTGLEGKSVYVAGGSRGIGLGIAQAFLNEGASVTMTARDGTRLAEAAADLISAHGEERVHAMAGDLTNSGFAQKSLMAAARKYDGLDVVIANAGGGTDMIGWDVPSEEWQRVFAQNFWLSQSLAQHAVPLLKDRLNASIVFIASIAGAEEIGAPASYTTAKAAVVAYGKSLARAVGSYGIRVNVVAPGNVVFPGGRWEQRLNEGREKIETMLRREVPLARFGTPQEIAAAVVFLASVPASFITGSCLLVDGGQSRTI